MLNCVSGRAGGGAWVSAGVRTWSEGKGPANAEWQLIIPDRYISICPPARSLLLWACCRHQAFQQRWTYSHINMSVMHTHQETLPSCSKQSLGQNLIKRRLWAASRHYYKLLLLLMCGSLIHWLKLHILMQEPTDVLFFWNRIKPWFCLQVERKDSTLHILSKTGCISASQRDRVNSDFKNIHFKAEKSKVN